MMSVEQLNFLGLLLSALSAIVMIFAPPRVTQYNSDGSLIKQWVTSPRPGKALRGRLQSLWQLGPILLLAGFALQVPAAWKAIGQG